MGRGRNSAPIDSPQTDRANHYRGDCEYRPGSHSRIRPDARHHRRQSKTKKAQPWSGPKVREIFDPGIKAIHRYEVSDETGSRIYWPGRRVARRITRDDPWTMVSKCLLAPSGNFAVGLVGR